MLTKYLNLELFIYAVLKIWYFRYQLYFLLVTSDAKLLTDMEMKKIRKNENVKLIKTRFRTLKVTAG